MAFVRLLCKATKIQELRNQLEDEKKKAVESHKGQSTKYGIRQKYRHFWIDLKENIKGWFVKKCTFPKNSCLYKTVYKLKHDGTCENFTLKSVIGFISGCFLTYMCFMFFIFQLNFKLSTATIMCSIVGSILTIGLAFSFKVRCVVFLLLPQLFSKRGRQALMAYAFILAITGPAKNTLHNMGILSESLACGQEQLKAAVKQIIEVVKKPFYAIRDAIRTIVKTVKVIVKKIKEVLMTIKRIIMAILRVIKAAFQFLGKILNICNKELGTPFQRCMRVFEDAITDCHAKLGPLFSWLCSITYLVQSVCYIVKIFDVICIIIDFINDSIIGVVIRKVKIFVRHIRTMFYVRIKFSHSFHFETTQSKSISDIAAGIVTEIRQRTEKLLAVFDFMSCATSLFFFVIVLRVLHYRYKFLTNERFDNRFITKTFRTIDMRRAQMEKETILPLNHRERGLYIGVTSIRLVTSEKRKLSKAAVILGTTTVKLSTHMMADYALYWMLTLIRYHARFQSKVQAPNMVGLHVQGEGFLAKLLKSIVKAFQPLGVQMEIDTVPCLPDPIPPDYDRYIQIASLLILCWILTIFEPYGLRLRHSVMCYYHPTRAKQRAIWLYNHILRSRSSFLKFARRQLRRKVTGAKGITKMTCKEYLRANINSKWFRLCLGSDRQDACLLCAEVFRESDKIKPIRCSKPNCPGIYCEQCFADLQNLCTVCMEPIQYGDLSDISEEKDSSEDELRPQQLKRKKRKCRWSKCLKNESDEDSDADGETGDDEEKELSEYSIESDRPNDSDYQSDGANTDNSYTYQQDKDYADTPQDPNQHSSRSRDIEMQKITDYATWKDASEEYTSEDERPKKFENDSVSTSTSSSHSSLISELKFTERERIHRSRTTADAHTSISNLSVEFEPYERTKLYDATSDKRSFKEFQANRGISPGGSDEIELKHISKTERFGPGQKLPDTRSTTTRASFTDKASPGTCKCFVRKGVYRKFFKQPFKFPFSKIKLAHAPNEELPLMSLPSETSVDLERRYASTESIHQLPRQIQNAKLYQKDRGKSKELIEELEHFLKQHRNFNKPKTSSPFKFSKLKSNELSKCIHTVKSPMSSSVSHKKYLNSSKMKETIMRSKPFVDTSSSIDSEIQHHWQHQKPPHIPRLNLNFDSSDTSDYPTTMDNRFRSKVKYEVVRETRTTPTDTYTASNTERSRNSLDSPKQPLNIGYQVYVPRYDRFVDRTDILKCSALEYNKSQRIENWRDDQRRSRLKEIVNTKSLRRQTQRLSRSSTPEFYVSNADETQRLRNNTSNVFKDTDRSRQIYNTKVKDYYKKISKKQPLDNPSITKDQNKLFQFIKTIFRKGEPEEVAVPCTYESQRNSSECYRVSKFYENPPGVKINALTPNCSSTFSTRSSGDEFLSGNALESESTDRTLMGSIVSHIRGGADTKIKSSDQTITGTSSLTTNTESTVTKTEEESDPNQDVNYLTSDSDISDVDIFFNNHKQPKNGRPTRSSITNIDAGRNNISRVDGRRSPPKNSAKLQSSPNPPGNTLMNVNDPKPNKSTSQQSETKYRRNTPVPMNIASANSASFVEEPTPLYSREPAERDQDPQTRPEIRMQFFIGSPLHRFNMEKNCPGGNCPAPPPVPDQYFKPTPLSDNRRISCQNEQRLSGNGSRRPHEEFFGKTRRSSAERARRRSLPPLARFPESDSDTKSSNHVPRIEDIRNQVPRCSGGDGATNLRYNSQEFPSSRGDNVREQYPPPDFCPCNSYEISIPEPPPRRIPDDEISWCSCSSECFDLSYQDTEEFYDLVSELGETLSQRNKERVQRTMREFEIRSRQNQNLDKPILDDDSDDNCRVQRVDRRHRDRPTCDRCCRPRKRHHSPNPCNVRFTRYDTRREHYQPPAIPPPPCRYAEPAAKYRDSSYEDNYRNISSKASSSHWEMDPRTGEWFKVYDNYNRYEDDYYVQPPPPSRQICMCERRSPGGYNMRNSVEQPRSYLTPPPTCRCNNCGFPREPRY